MRLMKGDESGLWSVKPAAKLVVGDLTAGTARTAQRRQAWHVASVRLSNDVVEVRLIDRPWKGSVLARFPLDEALYVRERSGLQPA